MKTLLSLSLLALITAAPVALAGGKSGGIYPISFHVEGDEHEGPRMVREDLFQGKRVWFRISPMITSKHLKGFHAFQAEDGNSWGVAFAVSSEGWESIMQAATSDGGKLLRVTISGRAVDTLRIDKPKTNDQIIVVWKGISDSDLALIRSRLPEIGGSKEDSEKKSSGGTSKRKSKGRE